MSRNRSDYFVILDPEATKTSTRRRFGTWEVRAPNADEAARALVEVVLNEP